MFQRIKGPDGQIYYINVSHITVARFWGSRINRSCRLQFLNGANEQLGGFFDPLKTIDSDPKGVLELERKLNGGKAFKLEG